MKQLNTAVFALNVCRHSALLFEYSAAKFTRKELDITNTMNSRLVCFQMTFMLEYLGTHVTLKGQQVTNTMYNSQVRFQTGFRRELLAADLTLVDGVKPLVLAS